MSSTVWTGATFDDGQRHAVAVEVRCVDGKLRRHAAVVSEPGGIPEAVGKLNTWLAGQAERGAIWLKGRGA